MTPAKLQQVIRHVAGCTVCTEAWRLAQKLAEDSEANAEAPTERSRILAFPRLHRSAVVPAVAAAAVVILAVGLHFRDVGGEGSVLRSGSSVSSVATDGEIEWLGPASLPRDECLLHWRGPENAAYYKVRVTLASDLMNPLAEVEKLETPEQQPELQFAVPVAALTGLPAGEKLLVRLEAVHPLEGVLDAATFSFTIQ